MSRMFVCVLMMTALMASVWAECEAIGAEFKVPVKLKTRGKPKVGKWEKVDEILNGIGENLGSADCKFTFGELFKTKQQEELYFPLTNSVLRIAPEESFTGITVFTKEGTALGTFSNRVRYERAGGLQVKKSYSVYYFQYKNPADKLQSVGHRLLLDDFVVKWIDIKDKVAVSGR